MEALAALALSVVLLHERWSPSRLSAVAMVVAVIYWLRRA
jgi:drug/metabolite transporter (DMT)-like permease